MKNKKESKLEKLKIAWKNPQKKALIKLCLYFILFFIIIIGSVISNSLKEPLKTNKTQTEFISNLTYNEMKQNLLVNKYDVKYKIINNNIEYKINGNLENNILTGYLELPDNIIKIKYEDDIFYQISNDVINEYDVSLLFDKEIINIKKLFETLSNTQTIINTKEDSKDYNYVININDTEYNVLVSINKNFVYKIELTNDLSRIIMNFDNMTE